jgi:foldase protein PrsA
MTRLTRPAALALAVVFTLAAFGAAGCTTVDKNVVATVNGSPIKIEQITAQLAQMKKQSPQTFEGTQGVAVETEYKARILESLIQLELITQAAKTLGVEVTDKQVDEYLAQLETQYGGKAGLDAAMKQSGVEMAQLRDSIKNRLLVDAVTVKSQTTSVTVTDAQVKAYYDTNKANFGSATEVDAQHILVASKDKALAEKILAQVKAGGDFAKLAKQYSTDLGSKDSSGNLGWKPSSQYVAEFRKATETMKVGAVTLVQTQFGWHVIKLLGRKPGTQKTLEDVKVQIRQTLESQGQTERFQAYVDDLRKKAKVEVLDPALKKIIDAQSAATSGESAAPSK